MDQGLPSSAFCYCLHTRMCHQEQWQVPPPKQTRCVGMPRLVASFFFLFQDVSDNNSHFESSFLGRQVTIFPELPWWFKFIVLHCISEPLLAKHSFSPALPGNGLGHGLNEDCQEFGKVAPKVSSAICDREITRVSPLSTAVPNYKDLPHSHISCVISVNYIRLWVH